MQLKMESPFKWNVTQNEVSLNMNVTQNKISLKIEFHLKWNVT